MTSRASVSDNCCSQFSSLRNDGWSISGPSRKSPKKQRNTAFKKKQLIDIEQGRIVGLSEAGLTPAQIAIKVKRSKRWGYSNTYVHCVHRIAVNSTIQRKLKKLKSTGSMKRKIGTGVYVSNRVTSPRQDRRIVNEIKKDRQITAGECLGENSGTPTNASMYANPSCSTPQSALFYATGLRKKTEFWAKQTEITAK